jgi:diacylglycerol kinase family enzyme
MNRNRVWLLIAAVLALAGGRFGRRAATRGLLAAGAITGARRADADAAVAFAFATGAAMELPWLTLPLAGAAAVASWPARSRRLGVVAVGASVGTGVALATRRVWPVAPHEPARARAVTGFGAGGPVAGAAISIVVNAAAGPALGGDPVARLEEAVPDANLITVDEPDELPAALERAAAADVIGVCGGDGTVNRAAAFAHKADKPLLVVPGGTLNHFAGALGLHTIDDVAAVVRGGQVVAVDLGTIADRVFLNVASFGVYTDLVDAREQLEHRIGKWPAVVVALTRVLRRADALELEIDGRHRRVWMTFIGNCRYHPSGFAPSWRERLDDGELDIRIVDAASPWSRTRLVLAVLTGRLGRSRVYSAHTASELSVRSLDGSLRIAVDGEVFDGPARFTVAKDPTPLRVLAPAP